MSQGQFEPIADEFSTVIASLYALSLKVEKARPDMAKEVFRDVEKYERYLEEIENVVTT